MFSISPHGTLAHMLNAVNLTIGALLLINTAIMLNKQIPHLQADKMLLSDEVPTQQIGLDEDAHNSDVSSTNPKQVTDNTQAATTLQTVQSGEQSSDRLPSSSANSNTERWPPIPAETRGAQTNYPPSPADDAPPGTFSGTDQIMTDTGQAKTQSAISVLQTLNRLAKDK